MVEGDRPREDQTSKNTVEWHNRLVWLYIASGCPASTGEEEVDKNHWPEQPT